MFSAPSNYRHSMYHCYIRKASTIKWRYLKLHKQNLTKVLIYKSYDFESIPTRCAEVYSETIVWYIGVSMNQCMKVRWLGNAVVLNFPHHNNSQNNAANMWMIVYWRKVRNFDAVAVFLSSLYFYSLSFEIIPI